MIKLNFKTRSFQTRTVAFRKIRIKVLSNLVFFLAGVLAAASALSADVLLDSISRVTVLSFCGEPVPFSNPDVQERFEKEMLLNLSDRPQVLLWLKRETRYLGHIREALKARKMPLDLQYLAIAESALRPHAGSPKGAIGFWQLLPETARNFGLTVDDYVDERRQLEASTHAALNYLDALHQRFGTWTLAVAAYNMGEEGLAAEILEQNTKDYYKLYLPLETQRFVFRILAAKLILEAPQAFGFEVKPDETYLPLTYDTVIVNCFDQTPIRLVAEAAGTYFKMIKDLNPHLRGHYLREGRHSLRLPSGSGDGFNQRFSQLVQRFQKQRNQYIYIVKPGDSLSGIATKFDVPLAALLIWNRVGLNQTIHPGDRLVIFPRKIEEMNP